MLAAFAQVDDDYAEKIEEDPSRKKILSPLTELVGDHPLGLEVQKHIRDRFMAVIDARIQELWNPEELEDLCHLETLPDNIVSLLLSWTWSKSGPMLAWGCSSD